MLVLITYDVNTETPAGKEASHGRQTMRKLWAKGAELGL